MYRDTSLDGELNTFIFALIVGNIARRKSVPRFVTHADREVHIIIESQVTVPSRIIERECVLISYGCIIGLVSGTHSKHF